MQNTKNPIKLQITDNVRKTVQYDKMVNDKNLENCITSFDEMPLFLDVKHLMQVLHIGRNSAYQLFNAHGFPRIKVAGQYRANKHELMEWLQNQ